MLFLKNLFESMRLRTLKIDILTLFISLTVLTFFCLIGYSYFNNYHAILKYSKGSMERTATAIIERIHNIQNDSEQMLYSTSGILIDNQRLSIRDSQLQRFMLNVLDLYPNASSLFLAFDSGSLVSVQTVNSSVQTHFISEPDKALPKNAEYILQIIDVTKQSNPEIWYYLDHSYKVVASEQFPHPTLDVKMRPWYLGAIKNKNIYWSGVYRFAPTNELGLTVSYPIYNNNQAMAVMGTDIAFKGLSDFLSTKKISKYGHTFIINDQGELLIPERRIITPSDVPAEVSVAAAAHFKKSHNHNFSFKFHHIRYLVYVSNLPYIFHQHWQLLTIVPFSELFHDLIKTQMQQIFIAFVILIFSILIVIYFSNRISKPIVKLAKQIDKITNLDLSYESRAKSYIIEIRMMDSSVAALRAAIRSFSRYVPKEIVQHLLMQDQEINLHVEKAKLTILFSDIQGFTTIAETHSLNMLMPLLNTYLDGLSKIILQNQGTIDKYIGDSIMAFWGAPLTNPNNAVDACKTTLECRNFVIEFNKNCRQQGKPEFITRFGLSSGSVVVGNIGTQERMNYTVIGDTVNAASRLQNTGKIYQVAIIISEALYNQTQGQFLVRPLDIIEVRGKKAKIKIYELVAYLTPDTGISATLSQQALCQAFTEAYHLFTEGNYQKAQNLFENIHQQFPEDYPTQFYLNRLNEISKPSEKR